MVPMLLSRESSEKAHLGCHICRIKWLAHSQIAYNRKTPCTHHFPCSLRNESWKNHPLFIEKTPSQHDWYFKFICIDASWVTALLWVFWMSSCPKYSSAFTASRVCNQTSQFHRIVEWFTLEGTLKPIKFQLTKNNTSHRR